MTIPTTRHCKTTLSLSSSSSAVTNNIVLLRLLLLLLAVVSQSPCSADPVVALVAPPMGFMSWERFRCETNCTTYPHHCINEDLYVTMADALVDHGYAAAGYTQVSIDDCWTWNTDGHGQGGRHPVTHQLVADPDRFPRGIEWLAQYLHTKGLQLGIYADAGVLTCGKYVGSQHFESIDAQTFADWGVDYVKYDGCNIDGADRHNNHHNATPNNGIFERVYTAFGTALKEAATATTNTARRPMSYSCSWPAYLGSQNESMKPYGAMYHKAGCNTWRNYKDIQNTWASLKDILYHWADHWQILQKVPLGSFNDADMLLVGNDHYDHLLSYDQVALQLGMWAMMASPLFLAGDVRSMPELYRHIALNRHVIAINQDVSRKQADCVVGCRGTLELTTTTTTTAAATATRRLAATTNGSSTRTNTIGTTHIRQPHPVRANSSDLQVWSKSLQGGESHALAFVNLQSNDVTTISYSIPLAGAVARCVDLWIGDYSNSSDSSSDIMEDVCDEGRGNTTDYWDIQLVHDDNGKAVLQIQALDVAATSHRLLRIDYFCEFSSLQTAV